MKTLTTFIKENLDDNLFWKIEMWFNGKNEQLQEFLGIIEKCENGTTVSLDKLTEVLPGTLLYGLLKEFVNFMIDDITNTKEKDYIYQLKKIIDNILGNKKLTIYQRKQINTVENI